MLTAHGQWKLEVNNKVVIQWFSKSWNEEAIIAYIEDFRATVEPLIDDNWAILSIFEDWELGVPEIEKHVKEHVQWFLARGCIRDCHVYTPDIMKKMQLEKMIPTSKGQYQREVFTELESAVTWLQSEGFALQHSDGITTSF